ncbi:MAG: hypothetical protein M3Z03_16770, partial [Actinomycetota bacterium]|nr:hypothetical protein [Actinomycetota bacterium]
EKDHEIEVAVADLPPGVDPADLAGDDPDRLVAAVDNAVPFLKFRVDRVLLAGRLDTAEGRARAAEAAIEVIREHPSALVRDQYVMEVAGRCRVEPQMLREALAGPPRPSARNDADRSAREGPAPLTPRRRVEERDGPELEVLRHVLHAWEGVEPWLQYEELFLDDLHARSFRVLLDHPTVAEAIEAADPLVADLLARLATEELNTEPFDAVVRLLTERARHEIAELANRIAAEPDDVELLRLQHWLTQTVNLLRDPNTADGASEQLVAWLGTRAEGEG